MIDEIVAKILIANSPKKKSRANIYTEKHINEFLKVVNNERN